MDLYRYYIHNKSIDLNSNLEEFTNEINLKNKRSIYQNSERDEIRRKLASTSSFGELDTDSRNTDMTSDYLRKSSFSKTNYRGQNLQICFMNEIQNEDLNDDEVFSENYSPSDNGSIKNNPNSYKSTSNIIANLPAFSFKPNSTCDDLLSQHYKLQTETKESLCNVPFKVKVQMENENTVNKIPSPIADIVGLPTYGLERLTRGHIRNMNIGQLQVIANDLCNQIENINEKLKLMLIDRDDLYMQQDSFLVDIEDVSNRIQEYSVRIKKCDSIKSDSKSSGDNNNSQKQSNSSKINVKENNVKSQMSSKFAQFNTNLVNKWNMFSRKTN